MEQGERVGAARAVVRRLAKQRYVILGILCLMYFVTYIDRGNISVAGPRIADEWGLDPVELGLIFSVFAYPYAGMQVAGGWLADKFGPRLVLGVLSAIWALATLLSGFVHGMTTLLACRFLLGIGEGGAFPTATRAFTYWMPTTERGLAQGLTHGFSRIGGAAAPAVVLALMHFHGWRASFIVLGTASFGWTLLWLLVFRNTPVEHPWVKPAELREIGVDWARMKSAAREKTPWRSMLRRMWLITAVDFCYGWALWVFLQWLPSYLKGGRGYDDPHMALYASTTLLAGVVGDVVGGLLSDAVLRRTRRLRLARVSILSGGLFGAFIFLTLGAFAHEATSAVVFLALSFFFLELTNGVLWALPIDVAVKYAGTAGGMMNSGFGLAGMVSPILFGYLLKKTGSYEIPLAIAAALLLVGAVMALAVDPTKRVEGAGEAAPLEAAEA